MELNKDDAALKPCPFCGGQPEFEATGVSWVQCPECLAESASAKTQADAAKLWNARAQQPDHTELVAEGRRAPLKDFPEDVIAFKGDRARCRYYQNLIAKLCAALESK